MDRTPPLDVRRTLRREVGFGCPVPGCGSPYLTWHHFDPPWREHEHHDSAGMIALCREHHDQADAGAFTVEQLRMIKHDGPQSNLQIQGQFNWLRNRLLAVVGGNFFYETPVIVAFREQPVVWLNRDDEDRLLLNVRMLSNSGMPRMHLDDSYWVACGDPTDLECPPSGRLIHARYANGDELRIEFRELAGIEAASRRYPDASPQGWGVGFPITAVEIHMNVGGADVSFGPRSTTLPGNNVIHNCFMSHCGTGIALG